MFRLPAKNEVFPTICVIDAPDGEKTVQVSVKIHFRVLPAREFRELANQGDHALFERLIGGWENIFDESGEPLICDAENIRRAADIPYFVQGVVRGYQERFSPTKNFKAPRQN